MRHEDYDIIHTLHDHVEEFIRRHGIEPCVLVVSPEAYQWLRALQDAEGQEDLHGVPEIGDWLFRSDNVLLRVEIDEMADNFTLRLR
ncbi:MAG: hypothetical protein M5R41_05835 [Bacteroidia bacterium]|nr:hypothetical protein [Bacteroidia bacterium]